MDITQSQDLRRLELILHARSYRTGSFVLASGKTSSFYLDVKETALDPEGAFLIGKLFAQEIESSGRKYGGVGGLTMGADPLATATSLGAFARGISLPAFLIRKDAKGHGTRQFLEGKGGLNPLYPLLVLEDVSTTGKSSIEAVEKARDAGFRVEDVWSVVDREEGAKEALAKRGCKLYSLTTLARIQKLSKT